MKKKFNIRIKAFILLLVFLFQTIYPSVLLALTNGPAQPEFQRFKSIGMSEMVNLSTGDFQYSIPLMDVGGYPLNLFYDGGVTMDQEASWTGLGWNLNVGAINRQKRGIPDDFNGSVEVDGVKDNITKRYSTLPDWSVAAGLSASPEIVGIGTGSSGMKIAYHRRNGLYFTKSLNLGVDVEGIRFGVNCETGGGEYNISPSLSFAGATTKNGVETMLSFSSNMNSSEGLESLSMGLGDYEKNRNINFLNYGFQPSDHTPDLEMNRAGISLSSSFGFGGTGFLADFMLRGSLYFSYQNYTTNNIIAPAFGVMNLQHSKNIKNSVLDFNEEDQKLISENMSNLSIPVMTDDIFAVQAHGINGIFSVKRSDVGAFCVSNNLSQNISRNFSAESNVGNLFDMGFDVRYNGSKTKVGGWDGSSNEMANAVSFKSKNSSLVDYANYEPFYLKFQDELCAETDYDMFELNGGFDPVYGEIDANGWSINQNANLKAAGSNYSVNNDQSLRSTRMSRNGVVSFLSSSEVQKYALSSQVQSVYALPHHIAEIRVESGDGSRYFFGETVYSIVEKELNFNIESDVVDKSRGTVEYALEDRDVTNGKGRDHIFSEHSTSPYVSSWLLTNIVSPNFQDLTGNGPTDDDYGTYVRFRYGNASIYKWRNPTSVVPNCGSFNEGVKADEKDDMAAIRYGEKEVKYIKCIETKTHVAVFFLSDRLDSRGVKNIDGEIDDENGLMKLDKICLYTKADWLAANLNVNTFDIEDLASLVPLKSAHFEYDYSLCPHVPNSLVDAELNPEQGKLTLKRVYFTFKGTSERGAYNCYNFDYSTFNPSYNAKAVDIWGTYKPQPSASEIETTDAITNDEFPYVDQLESSVDQFSQAWNLVGIHLPSGGYLQINYECDDYAFVQDRKAMDMFNVIQIDSAVEDDLGIHDPIGNKLYDSALSNEDRIHNTRIYFKRQPNDQVSTLKEMYDHYFKQLFEDHDGLMYFNCEMQLTDESDTQTPVQGYGKIPSIDVNELSDEIGNGIHDDFGFFDDPIHGKVGYVVLEMEEVDGIMGSEMSPIVKTGMNFLRMNFPKVASGSPNYLQEPQFNDIVSIKNFISEFVSQSIILQTINFARGPFRVMLGKNYCQNFDPNRTWIRLSSPVAAKYGGGNRVSSIYLTDNWHLMNSSINSWESQSQGLEYIYKQKDETLSSGVASYEPMLSKANPFVVPRAINRELIMVPDIDFYQDNPLGYSFFPGSNVIYSRVVVKTIQEGFEKEGVTHDLGMNGIGKTVYEFFTSKDYPVAVKSTPLKMPTKRQQGKVSLGGFYSKEILGASQGFLVLLNNMSGKLKKIEKYAQYSESPFSSEEYIYQKDDNDVMIDSSTDAFDSQSGPGKYGFQNDCVTIDENGRVAGKHLGVDWTMYADFKETMTNAASIGANADISTFLASIFPAVMPTIWPTGSYNKVGARTSAFVKIIRFNGILKEVVKVVEGSTSTTRNLAWDDQTGQVILTSTKNEFGDEYYSLRMPAYWIYKGMGPAYDNIGLLPIYLRKNTGSGHLEQILNSSQQSNIPVDLRNYFHPGDMIATSSNKFNNRPAWVLKVESNDLVVITEDGSLIPNPFGSSWSDVNETGIDVQILYSGNRNRLGESAGSLVFKQNPIQWSESLERYLTLGEVFEVNSVNDLDVISAGATTFRESWSSFGATLKGRNGECPNEVDFSESSGDFNINPFIENLLGQWYPHKNWVYRGEVLESEERLSSRGLSGLSNEFHPDLRSDGILENFSSFWLFDEEAVLWTIPQSDADRPFWQWTEETTSVNPNHGPVEARDPLGVFKSILFGYKQTLITLEANNAMQSEVFFECFEDASLNSSIHGLTSDCLSGVEYLSNEMQISNADAHTGKRSLNIGDAPLTLRSRVVFNDGYNPNSGQGMGDESFEFTQADIIKSFGPYVNPAGVNANGINSYTLSFWIKGTQSAANDEHFNFSYQIPDVSLVMASDLSGTPSNLIDLNSWTYQGCSEIIDGWQKLQYRFVLSASDPIIDPETVDPQYFLLTIDPGELNELLIDDVRIFPELSTSVAYVYDPSTLELSATLDDNNFATFYDYDLEGKLVRMRRETERGTYTIQESRSSIVKR